MESPLVELQRRSEVFSLEKKPIVPILSPEKLPSNIVILITSQTPGTGSSSLGKELAKAIGADFISLDEGGKELADRQVFARLAKEKRVIVEGERAVLAGPAFLTERPSFSLICYTDAVTAALRIFKREKEAGIGKLLFNPSALVDYLNRISSREKFPQDSLGRELPEVETAKADVISINTGKACEEEIVAALTGKNLSELLPFEKEMEILKRYFLMLQELIFDLRTNQEGSLDSREIEHIEENLKRINYQLIERFPVVVDGEALDEVRRDIKKALVNLLYPIYRILPKFYLDSKGKLAADVNSHSWCPEYYKLARSWPVLERYIAGKNILDPFAGSGTFMTYLTARDLPNSVIFGDICYSGGKRLEGGFEYYPRYNVYLFNALLDELPFSYRPECYQRAKGFITLDAAKPPFRLEAFDLVVGDPPYGKNLKDGSLEDFIVYLRSLLPLAKEGGMFLIPIDWLTDLNKLKDVGIKMLTRDLSIGTSNLPTCFIHAELKRSSGEM